MSLLWDSLVVGAGGLFGALMRHSTNQLASHLIGGHYSMAATFFENMAGSFLIGFFYTLLRAGTGKSHYLSLFLLTGAAGSYTTYSAFMTDALLLARESVLLFLVFTGGQIALGLGTVWLGSRIAQTWVSRV